MVTLRRRLELLREQVIAAAHAADGSQLRFGHKHPQGAGRQVSACVQPDHDRFLETGDRVQGKELEESARMALWTDGGVIDDDRLQVGLQVLPPAPG